MFKESTKMVKRSIGSMDHITPYLEEFQTERLSTGNQAFAAYDFGDREVDSVRGWRWDIPGSELRRTVFVRGSTGPTEAMEFIVRFRDDASLEIIEVLCGPSTLSARRKRNERQRQAADRKERRPYKDRQFVARIKIENPRELFEAAFEKSIRNGDTAEAAVRCLLDRKGSVDIDACLIAMLDPGALAGCEIYYSDAEPIEDDE